MQDKKKESGDFGKRPFECRVQADALAEPLSRSASNSSLDEADLEDLGSDSGESPGYLLYNESQKAVFKMVKNAATNTDNLQDEEKALSVSYNSKGSETSCAYCTHSKKELHELRVKNIALRDDCNKLRRALNIAKKAKADLVPELMGAKAKQDEHHREYLDWEALSKKQDEKLLKTTASLKKLQKAFKQTNITLKDTFNVKLRYEAIFDDLLLEMKTKEMIAAKTITDLVENKKAPTLVTVDKKTGELVHTLMPKTSLSRRDKTDQKQLLTSPTRRKQ